ncbi:magnesium transporter CorA family protein [Puniceicoccus vermicola]|uniref:Magnesium transport protein CorA n=1 Tax=Puniceicoccus vermicola TaxID=388746 RepID=A0A7X1AYG3_9BACT|nr:magnesium transporter CorA family protein [Puniceicoccus vermicola]MBC2602277.1 magnesium transporter CorA family protein [Puniceicoccus vermicola]
MFTIYELSTGKTITNEKFQESDHDQEPLWVDLFQPTETEIELWNERLGLDLPTRPEMEEIESTSRLYVEDHALFMTATVLSNSDEPGGIRTTPVTFVLGEKILVTMRFVDNQPFRQFIRNLERRPGTRSTPAHTLSALLDSIVDRLADILERVGTECDRLSSEIFRSDTEKRKANQQSELLKELLRRTGQNGETIAKSRESLMTINRIIVYFLESIKNLGLDSLVPHVKGIGRDVQSLSDHANYLDGKVAFLLDAILGLINIEQNQIIKIFSIAAVIFLPPTVVASIYGMNFSIMPELRQEWGYPFALSLMVVSAILPFVYFRRKGWI